MRRKLEEDHALLFEQYTAAKAGLLSPQLRKQQLQAMAGPVIPTVPVPNQVQRCPTSSSSVASLSLLPPPHALLPSQRCCFVLAPSAAILDSHATVFDGCCVTPCR